MPPKGQVTCDCGTCQTCKKRVYMNAYYRRNREAILAWQRRVRQERPEVYRDTRPWRHPGAEKLHARNAVNHAINQSGTLKRQPCEVCGDEKSHAHHDDYSNPLEVRWLCSYHHGMEHRKIA